MDASSDPQYRTADGSALRIWADTARNKFLSEKHGRPIFDEVIYVEVISPGSRDSTPVCECVRTFAQEMNRPEPLYGMKYAEYKQYIDAFIKSEEVDTSLAGTPLAQWAEMDRRLIATLKAQNIFTVDALAALPDSKLQAVGPDGRPWREKAKAFLENAKGNAYATALASENEQLRADSADLQRQIKELADQVAALTASAAGQGGPTPPPETPPATPAAPKAGKVSQAVPVAVPVDPLAPAPSII